ncbi:plancitoxin-1-like [Ptychodera flava]|uniref:plancitoxin-1-like n=1 Tax=Ptychodera flava TaxID=63121 RepID=UPI00396A72ED
MLKCVILAICLFKFFSLSAAISCKDDNGNDVDWFIIYKLPKISESNNELVKAGVGYYYFDPIVQTGRLSTVGIDSPNQSLGITVNQIYRNYDAKNVAHLMYSDSPPNDKSVPKSKGHTKGVVCLNTAGGFWLIHSVRLFPTSLNSNSKYSWPDNARIHGQSLLCISANVRGAGFQKIVTALQYNCPGIYDHRIPDVVENAVKGLSDVVQGNCKQSEEDCKYHAQIKRRGGVAIDIFAKSKQFKKVSLSQHTGRDCDSFDSDVVEEEFRSNDAPESDTYTQDRAREQHKDREI